MSKEKIAEDKKDLLENLLENNSFKIKPIIIELKNYSYYHSAISDDEDDYNNRFIGRSNLITKIRSFVMESSKNSGTYLISGFRGMGKTSVVNKALSNLNPKPKSRNLILIWLLLLPLILVKGNNFEYFFNNLLLFGIGFTYLIYIYFQIHTSTRLKSKKLKNNLNWKNAIVNLFLDFFKPNYQREKYVFLKNFRFFII